ncbi:MAG: GAF:ATP-binding region, ATPase-like:Histidine kinase internal region:5TM Receptors of the LytS-YhcK [Proteobacteria bacterium]|nr:GAF:ATP-binding region, ATPase-like:Histidine kinase internal region:5TM Receptors of the LytS-YhcK [Pseudomonadota bacterium]
MEIALDSIELILTLLQQTCVYLVIAYLLSRTRIFIPLMHVTIRLPHRLTCYVVFSLFCIMGTYLGLKIDDSIANTRAIGAVLGGVLGGPWVGLAVGFTGGLHRYSLGGSSAFACMVSTILEGLIGGVFHLYMMRRGRFDTLFRPLPVALLTLFAEFVQMSVLLLLVEPPAVARHLVEQIAVPMLLANSLGAGLFMRILLDRRQLYERQSSVFSTKALSIAARVEGLLRSGFNIDTSMQVARIFHEETGVGAVAITDTQNLLAFIGIGSDHHLPGTPISSVLTLRAIERNEVIFADGNEVAYQCSISPKCPLGASLIIPLLGEEDRVIGTVKLYEPRTRLFSTINRALGEGIARLLSNQILAGRYMRQRELLAQSEIKLLHAQVNPHFLFNALNTLSAVIRRDPERACHLVLNLSTFFRNNLKRPSEEASLGEEVAHVAAYLEIEQARFLGQLVVDFDIPEDLRHIRMPAFSLQPVVENAIKHGTSQLLEVGHIRIAARAEGDMMLLSVEDNAGLYVEPASRSGLGMHLVRRRIASRYGSSYGLEVACERELFTRVTLKLPLAPCAPETALEVYPV